MTQIQNPQPNFYCFDRGVSDLFQNIALKKNYASMRLLAVLFFLFQARREVMKRLSNLDHICKFIKNAQNKIKFLNSSHLSPCLKCTFLQVT